MSAQATCFTAGIVKGLIENKDATRHFGSLYAFSTHWSEALELGLVTGERGSRKVTRLGRKWYKHLNMADFKDGRSLYWDADRIKIDWVQSLDEIKGT